MSERPIRRALISVSDKTGLVEFARALVDLGVEIVSTGGTARELAEAGLPLRSMDDFTGFPEMLDGRVKTLHPRVHAGILYRRDLGEHADTMREHELEGIDMVVVNLYPFEETVARPGVTYDEAVEQIDIGGPSMTRSAAKNHAAVTVVVAPEQYDEVLAEMNELGGATSTALRQRFAVEAFRRTATYDAAITAHFERELDAAAGGDAATETELPPRWQVDLPQARTLRYGENPQQKAALYGSFLDAFRQLHGKELSYNNILDLSAAQEMAETLGRRGTACVIIKHSNPCGAAVGATLEDAWRSALECDPSSASGGIIGCSVPIDRAAAEAMQNHFIEVLVAPAFSDEALEVLRVKKNRILLECSRPIFSDARLEARSVPGGVLVQSADPGCQDSSVFRVATERQPTDSERDALLFGWDLVRFVKSNAIVIASADRTIGIGAGQMSRVDAARLAILKARQAGLDPRDCVVASDAFFPFPDGLIVAAEAGVTAAIQPGGSVRDDDVIAAANERGMAMMFTGARHFRH